MKLTQQTFFNFTALLIMTMLSSSLVADSQTNLSKAAAKKALAAKSKLVTPKEQTNKNYPPYPNIHFKTNMGDIYLTLNSFRAPITVENFLDYVVSGHYDQTIFHRVIPGFVAQGGGYLQDFKQLNTNDRIINESGNGLSNVKGTIAMARENPPHSANSQFYINLVDNQKLDPRPDRWGYTVFGEVLYGMNLLNKFANMPTGSGGSFSNDVPLKPLIIEKARIMDASEEIPMEPIVYADEIEEDDMNAKEDTVEPKLEKKDNTSNSKDSKE